MPAVTSYPAIVSDTNAPQGAGTQWIIDNAGAGRVQVKPAEYTGVGAFTGGHYAVAQQSGTIAATIGAAGHLARIRWTDATRFCVLHRIKVGITIIGAVTTATQTTFQAVIARAFSVDFTTAATFANMAAPANTGKMRASMSASLMGLNGPGISTTTVMSGQTLTADANPFAICSLPVIYPSTATGTAVALPVGTATQMYTLYEWTGLGQHPVVLAANEGVIVQPQKAMFADGTFALYVQWEWAEVAAF